MEKLYSDVVGMGIKNDESSARAKYPPYLSGDSLQLLAEGLHDKDEAGHRRVDTAVGQELKFIALHLMVGDQRMAVPARGDRQHLSRGIHGDDAYAIPAGDPLGDLSRSTSVIKQCLRRIRAADTERAEHERVAKGPSELVINLNEARGGSRIIGRVPVAIHMLSVPVSMCSLAYRLDSLQVPLQRHSVIVVCVRTATLCVAERTQTTISLTGVFGVEPLTGGLRSVACGRHLVGVRAWWRGIGPAGVAR